MKIKKILLSIFLVQSSYSFANYQQIIQSFKIETVSSQQEFNIRLAKLEDASFKANQNRVRAYNMSRRDPMGYNNSVCNAIEYSTALHKFTALNPLYTSQDTLNSMANSLFTNAAIFQNQSIRCPQIIDKALPVSTLSPDFYRKNISTETLDFLKTYDQKKKSIQGGASGIENIKFACETDYHFSKYTKLYLDNYNQLGKKDLFSYQLIEKTRRNAVDTLKWNKLESACVNGNLIVEPKQNSLAQIPQNSPIQNNVPDNRQTKSNISNEKIACGLTNMIFRSVDQNYKTDCNNY